VLADDQDADHIKGRTVDDTNIAPGKFLKFDGSFVGYYDVPGGGDMLKANYATASATKVDIALNAEKLNSKSASYYATADHDATHATGGTDAFDSNDLLDAIARVTVRANSGANVGSKRRLNFINTGSVTWTLSKDDGNEEVTVQASATAAGIYKLPYTYTIYYSAPTYFAMDEDGNIDFSGPLSDKAVVQQAVMDAVAAAGGGTVLIKEDTLHGTVTYGDTVLIIEEYQGRRKAYSNKGMILDPRFATDPTTSGWGTGESGRNWYSTGNQVQKYWNGTEKVTVLGSISTPKKSVHGTASGKSPITVAHGLGAAPNVVLLTPNALQPYAFSYNKDATNIYIYHNAAASLTFSYFAIL
jgi:hypothetical protein